MTLYASEFDQSRWLHSNDIGDVGTERRLKIRDVTKEVVGEKEEPKACVWFTTTDKGLLLNKTNLRLLQSAFGDDMSKWKDKIAIVFVVPCMYKGQPTTGMRIRIPPPKDNYRAPSQPATRHGNSGEPARPQQTAPRSPQRKIPPQQPSNSALDDDDLFDQDPDDRIDRDPDLDDDIDHVGR
jgi:hypothetical protein